MALWGDLDNINVNSSGLYGPPTGTASTIMFDYGTGICTGATGISSWGRTGFAGTGALGTEVPEASIIESGVAGTGAIGTEGFESSITETGVAGTGAVGTEVPEASITESGVAGTGATGTESVETNREWGAGAWNTGTWGE